MHAEVSKIVTYGNEILRSKAEDVDGFNDEIKELIQVMYNTMVESHGLGVAGPRFGVSRRIFVYDVGEGQHAFINPQITSSSGEEWAIEGCLSIPGLQGEVPRAEKVTVTGINEDGKKVKIKADGLLARVFQHEIDHLDGTMFVRPGRSGDAGDGPTYEWG